MCDRAKRGSFPEKFYERSEVKLFLFLSLVLSFFFFRKRKKEHSQKSLLLQQKLFFSFWFFFFLRKRTPSELRGSSFMSFRVASEGSARARLGWLQLRWQAVWGTSLPAQLCCVTLWQPRFDGRGCHFFCSNDKNRLSGKQQSNNQLSFAVWLNFEVWWQICLVADLFSRSNSS